MLKVYEWIVYIIIRPYKSFEHLINWFGIFIRAKTNYRKRKERLNRGKKKKTKAAHLPGPPGPTYLSSRPSPASRLASSSPRPEAARWNACSTPPTPPTSLATQLLPLA